jgi:hypothetical protein
MPYTPFSLPIKRSAITPGTLADRSRSRKAIKHPGYLRLAEVALEAILEKLDCFGSKDISRN